MADTNITRICTECGSQFAVPKSNRDQPTCSHRCGQLKRRGPARERFWSKVDRRGADECWPWKGGIGRNGYGQLGFLGTPWYAHRFAWMITHGPIPTGLFVLHSCESRYPPGDTAGRRCVNPTHLRPGTVKENANDMVASGRCTPRTGEASSSAKLTSAQVLDIRATTDTQRAAGLRHGISHSVVCKIRNRNAWVHIT